MSVDTCYFSLDQSDEEMKGLQLTSECQCSFLPNASVSVAFHECEVNVAQSEQAVTSCTSLTDG